MASSADAPLLLSADYLLNKIASVPVAVSSPAGDAIRDCAYGVENIVDHMVDEWIAPLFDLGTVESCAEIVDCTQPKDHCRYGTPAGISTGSSAAQRMERDGMRAMRLNSKHLLYAREHSDVTRVVVVDGNIGCGKTSLIDMLRSHLHGKVVVGRERHAVQPSGVSVAREVRIETRCVEERVDNDLFSKYVSDMKQHGLEFQMYMPSDKVHQLDAMRALQSYHTQRESVFASDVEREWADLDAQEPRDIKPWSALCKKYAEFNAFYRSLLSSKRLLKLQERSKHRSRQQQQQQQHPQRHPPATVVLRSTLTVIFVDRSIAADAYVFCRGLYERGTIGSKDWYAYLYGVEALRRKYPVLFDPDLLVYLHGDVDTCMQRIAMRNRAGERSGYDRAYLETIERRYKELYGIGSSAAAPAARTEARYPAEEYLRAMEQRVASLDLFDKARKMIVVDCKENRDSIQHKVAKRIDERLFYTASPPNAASVEYITV
jgi:deoxyadenosine/deoxycytidine kinase